MLPHGNGILRMKDRTVYEGSFELGHMTGYGVLTSHDGQRIESMFENGKVVSSEKTTLLFPLNDIDKRYQYKGEMKGSLPDGKGTLTWMGGQKYTG